MVKETDSDTIAALNSEGISLKQEETEIADHVCSAFILPVFSQVAFTSLSINYYQNLWALDCFFFMECCYHGNFSVHLEDELHPLHHRRVSPRTSSRYLMGVRVLLPNL